MIGFPSRYGRGKEMGGFLIGRSSRQGQRIVVEIDDFEPVRCEHAFGPSFLLSPEDRRAFEEQLSWRRSLKRGGDVVGFWRSHTRKGFELAVEDADLFALHFSRPSDVFLLIKANEHGPSTAGFVIWEGGRIRSNAPYLEFPFDRETLTAGAPPEQSATPPAAAGESASAPMPPQAPPPRKPANFGRGSLLWALAGLVVIVLSLWVGNHRRAAFKATGRSGVLALRVSPQGSGLRLDWDRNSPAIKTARSGILWITDGVASERIDLEASQLTSGGIAYWPNPPMWGSGSRSFRAPES